MCEEGREAGVTVSKCVAPISLRSEAASSWSVGKSLAIGLEWVRGCRSKDGTQIENALCERYAKFFLVV